MSSLGKELQKTIRNLEQLRDAKNPPQEEVLAKLDDLYEKQIDLIEAAINSSTQEYENATNAMKEAAKVTQKAIDDLANLEKAIDHVANAVAKVTELVSKVG